MSFQRLGRGSMVKHTLVDDIIVHDRTREIYADAAFNLAGKALADLPATPIGELIYDVAEQIRAGLFSDVCQIDEVERHWPDCLARVRGYLEKRGWFVA